MCDAIIWEEKSVRFCRNCQNIDMVGSLSCSDCGQKQVEATVTRPVLKDWTLKNTIDDTQQPSSKGV